MRGVLEVPLPARLHRACIELTLQEHPLGGAAVVPGVVVDRMHVDGARWRSAAFELRLPAHLPPSTMVPAPHGGHICVHWLLVITFELATLEATERPAKRVPWRLALRVLSAADEASTSRRRRRGQSAGLGSGSGLREIAHTLEASLGRPRVVLDV